MSDFIASMLLVGILFNLGWLLILSTCFLELESLFDKHIRHTERLMERLSEAIFELEHKK